MRIMRIREVREAAGISRKDLAERVKVDQSMVAKWETGISLPRAAKLPELAAACGCTIDALYVREAAS